MKCPELKSEISGESCSKMKKNEWCNQECLEISHFVGDSKNPDNDILPEPQNEDQDQSLRQKKRKSDGYRGLCLIKGAIISILTCRSGRIYARMHPQGKSPCIGCDWRKNFVKDGQPSRIKKGGKVALIEKITPIISTVSDDLILTISFNQYSEIWETLKNKAEEEIRTLQEQILYELKKTFSQKETTI